MDEVLRGESFLAGCRVTAYTAARVLVVLFGLVLAGSPVLREMTQDFLNAPIVPKATTEGSASAGGKQEGKVLKPDKAAIREEDELTFGNPVSEDEPVLDGFLAEVSGAEMSLELPRLSQEETYLAETGVPVMDIPENLSDNLILTKPVIPDADSSDDETAGNVSDMIVTEKTEDELIKAEVMVPEGDMSVGENAGKDSSVSEIMTQDPSTSEDMTKDPVLSKTETDDPSVSDPVLPVPPSDDLPVSEPIVPEPIVPEPIVQEPAVPEPGTDVSDVPDEITPDVGEDTGAEDAVSCFLLDDAGMLYGFLPEYAEIPEGCLTLPEECAGIRSGAFLGCGAEILELYIPAGVTTIEEGAFTGLNFLEWIEVDSGNPVYMTDSGVLFDSTMSILLAFPSAWTECYAVPGSVTTIAGRAFENTSLSLLDVRACGALSFAPDAFGASAGSGVKILAPPAGNQTYEETQTESGTEVPQ